MGGLLGTVGTFVQGEKSLAPGRPNFFFHFLLYTTFLILIVPNVPERKRKNRGVVESLAIENITSSSGTFVGRLKIETSQRGKLATGTTLELWLRLWCRVSIVPVIFEKWLTTVNMASLSDGPKSAPRGQRVWAG